MNTLNYLMITILINLIFSYKNMRYVWINKKIYVFVSVDMKGIKEMIMRGYFFEGIKKIIGELRLDDVW